MYSFNSHQAIENQKSDDSEVDVENRRTRGATKLEFLTVAKKRGNLKSKRKKGLMKKINEFDVITGSSSLFVSISNARTEVIF